MRRSKKTIALTLYAMSVAFLLHKPAKAQAIVEVEPDQIPVLVEATSNGKPLAVHYTSDDGSCSHCMENNVIVAAAAQRLSDNFDFVSVTLNPWREFFETPDGKSLTDFQAAQGFHLSGVPAVMIFANGQPIRLLPGANPSLDATLETTFDIISDQELIVRGDVSVANIPPDQFEAYVIAFSAEKPMLLTLSSTDEDCPHCITGNARIDDVSRYLSGDYVFARIDYNPWQSVEEEAQTATYLDRLGVDVNGLPMSFLFYEGKLLGNVVTNGRDLRTVLSQALPTILGRDQ